MLNSTFKASAIKKVAANAPKKITSIAGIQGPVFGSRLLEVDYTVKDGWKTPVLRDYGDLVLRPQISAFHYGLVVFDHLVVSRHKDSGKLLMFRPDMFLTRLAKSRDYLHFAKYDDGELLEMLKVFAREDEPSVPSTKGEKYLLRTTMIGNNNNLSAGPADEFKLYSFGCCANSNASAAPMKLKADSSVRRSWHGGTGELSMGGNYANQIFTERAARSQGFDRHLWLVDDDAISTAGDSNFFAVFKKGHGVEVVTPALDGTLMQGVVRDSVIQLLRKQGVDVREDKVTAADLRMAVASKSIVEAFATSSGSVTRAIGGVYYQDDMLTIPVPEDGFASKLKKAILDIQDGTTASEWTVTV
jgi:branched-chain amino acid aminotransferase